MSEINLWTRIKGGLEQYGHLQRIETGSIAEGVPDVNYCFQGLEGWVELKYGKVPLRATTEVFKSQPGMRPAQIDWILYRGKVGGRVFILLNIGTELFLIHGEHAAKVNQWTMQDFRDAACWQHRGPCRIEQWRSLRNCLTE